MREDSFLVNIDNRWQTRLVSVCENWEYYFRTFPPQKNPTNLQYKTCDFFVKIPTRMYLIDLAFTLNIAKADQDLYDFSCILESLAFSHIC